MNYASFIFHSLFFLYYFGEDSQFGGYIVEKIYFAYEIGFLFILACLSLKRFKLKIASCLIFVILSTPFLQYIIYPAGTRYVVGGNDWLGTDDTVYFDQFAITDIFCIIVFALTYLAKVWNDYRDLKDESLTTV